MHVILKNKDTLKLKHFPKFWLIITTFLIGINVVFLVPEIIKNSFSDSGMIWSLGSTIFFGSIMIYIFTRKSEIVFCATKGVVYYKIQRTFTEDIGQVKLAQVEKIQVISSGVDPKTERLALNLHGDSPQIFLSLTGDNVSDWEGLMIEINQWLDDWKSLSS